MAALDGDALAALAKPVMAIDPFVGPALDLGRTGAGLAPALPQRRQGIEPALPFDAEELREETLDAARQAGALPVGRHGDEQVAPAQQLRGAESADLPPVLHIAEDARA